MPLVAYNPFSNNLSTKMYNQDVSDLNETLNSGSTYSNEKTTKSTGTSSESVELNNDSASCSCYSNSGASIVLSDDGNCINICDHNMKHHETRYLDDDDIKESKKLVTKFINEIDENSRHHQIKLNQLSNVRFEDPISDAISVIHDQINEIDYQLSTKLNKKLSILDNEMNPLDEILKISNEMDQIEHYLDVTSDNIWSEFDTIDRIKRNIEKEEKMRTKISALEEKSLIYRSTLKAIQYDSGKIPYEKHECKVYGLAEHALTVPLALVTLTTFEKILAKTRRFYNSCVGLPVIEFDKIEAAIEMAKEELSIGCRNLSADQIACLSPLPTSAYSNYSLFSSTEGLSTKSLISSSNALERAISRSRSEMSESELLMPPANRLYRCSSSATISMSNISARTQSTQSCGSELLPRAALSCPNVDIDSVIRTALQYSKSVDNLVTAESPGPNTPSSTILI